MISQLVKSVSPWPDHRSCHTSITSNLCDSALFGLRRFTFRQNKWCCDRKHDALASQRLQCVLRQSHLAAQWSPPQAEKSWRAELVRRRRIIRASFSQERMTYVAAQDSSYRAAKVIYQSKDGKTTKTFDALDWLVRLRRTQNCLNA